jgi:hypothetical protein
MLVGNVKPVKYLAEMTEADFFVDIKSGHTGLTPLSTLVNQSFNAI